jgi:hypothetical protein
LSDEGDDPGLTDRVGPPVSEREATGQIGQAEQAGLTNRVGPPVSEREATGHWAGQGGRRWAAAGLENKGGGRAETISRAEIK